MPKSIIYGRPGHIHSAADGPPYSIATARTQDMVLRTGGAKRSLADWMQPSQRGREKERCQLEAGPGPFIVPWP